MYNELQIIMDTFTMATSVTHQWNSINCDQWGQAVHSQRRRYGTKLFIQHRAAHNFHLYRHYLALD
jgi:hypothetical protein